MTERPIYLLAVLAIACAEVDDLPVEASDAGALSDAGLGEDAGADSIDAGSTVDAPAPIVISSAREGSFELGVDPYRHTNLDVLPVDRPALALYEHYSGYTDHPLGAELVPLDGAARYSGIRLVVPMELGAVGTLGIASFETADGGYHALTPWDALEEGELPPGAAPGGFARISSGAGTTAVLSGVSTPDGPRGMIGRLDVVDGIVTTAEITPLPFGTYEASLASTDGSFGHCFAWASWTGYLSVSRRCSELARRASVDDLGAFAHWGTASLSFWPARLDAGVAEHASQGSLFTTHEGDVVIRAVDGAEAVDLVWVRGESNPAQEAFVHLASRGPIGSVARVGDTLLVVVLAEKGDALAAIDVRGREGWAEDGWRDVVAAPGAQIDCDGRMRLREIAGGSAWLTCDAPGNEVRLFRLSAPVR